MTQALWCEQCEILQVREDWAFVRTRDGYLGWAHPEPFATCDEQTYMRLANHRTHLIAALHAPVFPSSDLNPSDQITLLPFGVRVAVAQEQPHAVAICWIDGSVRWIDRNVLYPLVELPQRTSDGLRLIAQWLPRLLGVPYLWGGRTPFGYDCSGLVQIIYGLIGVPLPRDADQQCAVGQAISVPDIQLGDLLFFGSITPGAEPSTQHDSVSHVALVLDQHLYIHASRRGGGVGWGSLNAASPHYFPGMENRIIGVRRYL